MLGVVYLLLCFGIGWVICRYGFPELGQLTNTTYNNKNISLSPYILLLPVWFICGVLAMTWFVYIIALFVSVMGFGVDHPLTIANAITMPLALIIWLINYYRNSIKGKDNRDTNLLCKDFATLVKEGIIIGLITILAFVLMWSTFYVKDGQLNIGVSVFSDFSPHVGMIRSFSYGKNFPTSYSHFAGEDIRYHFMFQFLVGNLEFLGMRIDYAFNLPSMLSFISAFMLIYVLAMKITGKLFAAVLACLFFAFRSGKALFIYLSKFPKGANVLRVLRDNTQFIGDTPNEDWGLWNLNVYCNQRHLAFGLTAMFFILIIFIPHLYDMFSDIKKEGFSIKKVFLTKEGWAIKKISYPLAAGLLLGSLSFFHGSAVIGCLLVLFVIAVFSKNRLEFLITALIAVILSLIQSSCFIDESAVTPEFLFGFIAENKTIFGVASYLDRLLGILPIIIIIAFIFGKVTERYLILAALAPLIFSFMVSLTVDVTVNHKYIMMSCILLGIFSGKLIAKMFEKKDIVYRIAGGILILMLTLTGVYDFTTLLRKNHLTGKITLDMNDPITEFVRDNSDSKDIFLTDPYTINQLVFGGAMLYQGHQYYAWSAGYDTYHRDDMVARMYGADTPNLLDELVKENNIRFIIVDYSNRTSNAYELNEANIRATYECVYETGEDEWKLLIFDTKLPLI
ncbi:MAG: hypothetical protein GX237_06170 [Clostridiales bacterium]|nr:hypothetical protein [Clostridiales bacterium]